MEVRAHHVDDFIADIITATSPANGAHHYRNLRVFFGWLVKRREMPLNPMDQTDAPRVPEKITPLLTDEEHLRVLRACSGRDFASLRDTAIILLFIDTGPRLRARRLTVDGIDLLAGQFHVRGKGGKVRLVGFGNAAGLAVAKYLKARAARPGSRTRSTRTAPCPPTNGNGWPCRRAARISGGWPCAPQSCARAAWWGMSSRSETSRDGSPRVPAQAAGCQRGPPQPDPL